MKKTECVKVSVIVPIYNAEVFLTQTIDSILRQTYDNLEIILVNDCSRDNSLYICQDFAKKDNRIVIIDKKKNEGVDYARFSGIEVASGDYLMFLDADDWLMVNAVESLTRLALDKNVDIVYANSIRVYSNKFHIHKFREYDKTYVDRTIASEEKKRLSVSFVGINIIPVTMWGNLYSKSLFAEGLKKSGLRFGEDLALGMQLYQRAESVYLTSKPVLYYRWGGVTAKFQPHFIESAKKLYVRKIEFINQIDIPAGENPAIIELANCLASHVLQLVSYYPKQYEENLKIIEAEMSDSTYECFSKVKNNPYFQSGNLNEACVRLDSKSAVNIAYRMSRRPRARLRLMVKRLCAFVLRYVRL